MLWENTPLRQFPSLSHSHSLTHSLCRPTPLPLLALTKTLVSHHSESLCHLSWVRGGGSCAKDILAPPLWKAKLAHASSPPLWKVGFLRPSSSSVLFTLGSGSASVPSAPTFSFYLGGDGLGLPSLPLRVFGVASRGYELPLPQGL